MSETDLISDILQRIVEKKIKLPPKIAESIEVEIRRDWGGERHYIAKSGEAPARRKASERAESVYADHRRGEHVKLLARRYGISPRRVRQIIACAQAAVNHEVASNDELAEPFALQDSAGSAEGGSD